MITPGDMHMKIHHSMNILQSRASASAQEYRERLKRLRDTAIQIQLQAASGQLPLDIGLSIAPEIMALIDNPTKGL
jgi:hypothetical protein